MAKFWTDSWIEEIKKKIDMTAAQHFDGIYLDVMSSYWAWRDIYPSMEQEIVKGNQRLLEAISRYAHEQYGSSFMVTGNHGGVNYFSNFGSLVDGTLIENGFFRWDGSGVVDGHARSISEKSFKNPVIDYYRSEGLCLLSMEHLGTGPHDEDLDFKDYNNQMSGANYLLVFRWASIPGLYHMSCQRLLVRLMPKSWATNPYLHRNSWKSPIPYRVLHALRWHASINRYPLWRLGDRE